MNGPARFARSAGLAGAAWIVLTASVAAQRRAVVPRDEGGSIVPEELAVGGWLLDPEGRLTAGTLRVLRPGPTGLVEVASAEVSWNGWFELVLDEPGPVHLVARMRDRERRMRPTFASPDLPVAFSGSAAHRDVDPFPRAIGTPIELRARGPGVVRGRVLDLAGSPVADLDLVVRLVELERGVSPVRRDELDLEGAGRLEGRARTDAEGRFEVRGLRDDRFVVRAGRGLSWEATENPLTPLPVPSDGRKLELVQEPPPVLVVRVVGPGGTPWPGTVTPARSTSEIPWSPKRPHERPPDLSVVVAPAEPDPSRMENPYAWERGAFLAGAGCEDGLAFEVEPGHRYLVGVMPRIDVFHEIVGWRPRSVDIPLDVDRLELVVPFEDEPLGTLFVSPLDPGGAPTRGVEVRVEDPASGLPIVRVVMGVERGIRVPAGEYRLVVREVHSFGGCFGEPPFRYGSFETRLVVEPGREHHLAARLGTGARLRVHVVGAPRAEDHAVRESFGVAHDLERGARLSLSGPGRWRWSVFFAESDDPRPRLGLLQRLVLGTTGLSEPQPAGPYTLTARLPGGRVAEAPVELVDGETTDVELVFE